MIDFTPVRRRHKSMQQFALSFSRDDFRRWTKESVERFLALLDSCQDETITFVPADPQANDPYAADPADQHLAWTLGHVIVHATASAEEYAASGAELARGVPFHGRPRYELPWQDITSVAQCRQRLMESRRIRLASLEMWPDQPHLDLGYVPWEESGWVNAQGIFAWGLAHDDDHYRQAAGILAQWSASVPAQL
ncbi:DinB family protein [Ktedonosporobacter rubrisoli]|uniref:DinB family protein n=1 Tax=Ktedonosporobacter rubrisoli TaxID=2509675 RepID=A0A4P6JVY5_KTERU|nr:DinB family protein [Ktedonosporobacter rubrisoli]QBD79520.1 DinB family protein [Ktedonosporobacter rubrisoli]